MKIAKKIFFFLLISPVFLWIILRPKELISEWSKIPVYLKSNISSLVSQDKLAKVFTERWNAFGPEKEDLPSKIYYNKGMVLVDDFFSMTTYFSPRIYFQSGDGTNFSPPGVEPITIPMFVFWVMGIIALINNKKWKPFVAIFAFGIFAYLAGQRNFAFLFPIALIYVWISMLGIKTIKSPLKRNIVYSFLSLYGIFLLGRIFFLK